MSTLHAVYKKDSADVDDGSISPGLSIQDEDNDQFVLQQQQQYYDEEEKEDQSLVDILIQNSNKHQKERSSLQVMQPQYQQAYPHQIRMYDNGGPEYGNEINEQSSMGQLLKKGGAHHRSSGSFSHNQQRERNMGHKQKKIDSFIARQGDFKKRKEKNLKKLTEDRVWKEKHEQLTKAVGNNISAPQQSNRNQLRQVGGSMRDQEQRASIRNLKSRKHKHSSHSKNYQDSFDGLKDGVANKMHCDPHNTSSTLALQQLNFAGATKAPEYNGLNQYLTHMNTHPLLQQQMAISPNQQISQQSLMMMQPTQNNQYLMQQNYLPQQQQQAFMQQIPQHQQFDYYKTVSANFTPGASGIPGGSTGFPKPNAYHQRQISNPGKTSAHQSLSAAIQEEVLDEFPMPPNAHVAAKATEISIEQKSFLQMQNAINSSSNIDFDALGFQHMQSRGGSGDKSMQSETKNNSQYTKMMEVLNNNPQGSQDMMNSLAKTFSPQNPGLNGLLQIRKQSQHQTHSQDLEATRVMKAGSQGMQQKMHSLSSFNQIQQQQNIAKDIDILDSEFAQEEDSHQIEAYYRSINKDSADQLKSARSSKQQRKHRISPNKQGRKVGDEKGPLSPPSRGYQVRGPNRSMTERKLVDATRFGVSRLDVAARAASRENMQHPDQSPSGTDNRSQKSKSSQRSARKINALAVERAKQHLYKLQEKKLADEAERKMAEHKKKFIHNHKKNTLDELYLSNKLTRQFIMVTSLVMQSEDLSEDSIFNYAQYTEFAIRFGLMSEKAATEESDERALLYEMWCTLSRAHADLSYIRVVDLKTLITAILGFPVPVHRNPIKRKPQQKPVQAEDAHIVEEDPEETDESEFDKEEEDEVPTENYANESRNELRASKQTLLNPHDKSSDYLESNSHDNSNNNNNGSYAGRLSIRSGFQALYHDESPHSIIDEYDELLAAENGQLSSPSDRLHKKRHYTKDGAIQEQGEQSDENREESAEQEQEEAIQEQNEYGQESDTLSQSEYAIDRAQKIGFFSETYSQDFCMTLKDVRTVQRRFKLFHKNWRDFQKKDLIVKKSVMVTDGATFKPVINKKSDKIIREKEQGNLEFPFSNNSNPIDQRSQRRQKVWERELPRGVKSKERLYTNSSQNEFQMDQQDAKGNWLIQTAGSQPNSSSMAFPNDTTRNSGMHSQRNYHQTEYNDYFALHASGHQDTMHSQRNSSKGSQKGSSQRGLTNPKMTQRMEHIYQIGRCKMMNRQDMDQNTKEFEKQAEQCTFKPSISQTSKKIGIKRSFSIEEKPWLQQTNQPQNMKKNAQSQQQLAERMQLSIEKDIQRKKIAQVQKHIKDKVINHGGWPKDYVNMQSGGDVKKSPVFRKYDGAKQLSNNMSRPSSNRKLRLSYKRPNLQKFPITTNTSTKNLHEDNNVADHLGHLSEFNQGELDSQQSDKQAFSSPSLNKHQFIESQSSPLRIPQQTMLNQHQQNQVKNISLTMSAVSEGSSRQRQIQSPNSQVETGGVQFSQDEQGRAPSVNASSREKSVEGNRNESAQVADLQVALGNQNHKTQMLQKAMEELAVIQEKSFEQTWRGMNAGGNRLSGAQSSASKMKPLLFIEVDTNGALDGGIERIEVYKGDDPRRLAADFCRKHDFDEGTQIVLQRQIEDKLARAQNKLNQKMEEKRQNRLAEKFREKQALRLVRGQSDQYDSQNFEPQQPQQQ